MIRIDALWLAVEPVDMRAGADRLLARVVQVFGASRVHHAYLFASNRLDPVRHHTPTRSVLGFAKLAGIGARAGSWSR